MLADIWPVSSSKECNFGARLGGGGGGVFLILKSEPRHMVTSHFGCMIL